LVHSKGGLTINLAYVYFDLVHQPYVGFEYRVAELLDELGHRVFTIARHRCLMEGAVNIPEGVDAIYCSNPIALDVAVKVKEVIKKPLIVQFLDIPKLLLGSEEWRYKEYEKVREQVKQADYITAISETTARDVEEWLGKDCPEVLVNYIGVDVDLFQAFKPKEEGYICAVTRGLAKQKQHNEIIQAVNLSKSKPPLRIIFGQYSDVRKAKVISQCLFGLGMSTLEGFGVYVVEMGYYAKPFIGRRLPVFQEIFGDSIVYVNSAQEMAEKIDWLMTDEEARAKAGANLVNLVHEKRLYLSEHAKRLEKLLSNL
jgi:glycosyltransferase involved in cell wall biosynthesis